VSIVVAWSFYNSHSHFISKLHCISFAKCLHKLPEVANAAELCRALGERGWNFCHFTHFRSKAGFKVKTFFKENLFLPRKWIKITNFWTYPFHTKILFQNIGRVRVYAGKLLREDKFPRRIGTLNICIPLQSRMRWVFLKLAIKPVLLWRLTNILNK